MYLKEKKWDDSKYLNWILKQYRVPYDTIVYSIGIPVQLMQLYDDSLWERKPAGKVASACSPVGTDQRGMFGYFSDCVINV